MSENLIGKKFKYVVPLQKSESDDGRLYLDGVASTTNLDYDNDEMTPEAIESMKEQAIKGITGFDGHDYSLKSIFGKVVDVVKTGSDVFHPIFRVRKSKEDEIKELIEDGIALGLSVAGIIKDYILEGGRRLIKEVQLFEISVTPIPANPDTLGTLGLTEKGGMSITSQIFKSIEDKYFSKAYNLNSGAYASCMASVRSGSYDKEASWSFNDATDGGALLGDNGDNWSRYSKAFLATDPNGNPQSKGTYHFPIGKLVGGTVKYFRSGVAAASRAAGGARSGVSHNNIGDATTRILAAMDKKEGKSLEDLLDLGGKNMEPEEMIKGIVEGVSDSNQKMVKDLLEGLKADPEPATPPAANPPANDPPADPPVSREEIMKQVKADFIKELLGEPAEPEPEPTAYEMLVKDLKEEVLKEIVKERPHARRVPGNPKDKTNGPETPDKTQKTQTIEQCAKALARGNKAFQVYPGVGGM